MAVTDPDPMPARLCPQCGATTPLAVCEADATATLDLQAFETADWRLVPGQIVAGKYRILQEVARGGHGVVYKAEHLLGLGTVALKLPGTERANAADLRRFFREAQVSARLTGTHTARVLDVGQTAQGALYLAMEFVDGATLESLLRHLSQTGEVVKEVEARRIASQVLAGLAEAHAAGLVHRDLKPSNIAIRASDGAVKILDFGLAHVGDSSLTPNEMALGTPHYMSPEQCTGAGLDGRSDLYALGVTLYRMVTGTLPFVGDSNMAVLWGHVHKPPPDLASHAKTPVSAHFAQVVLRALAKRPDRRFGSAEVMREALESGQSEIAGEESTWLDWSPERPLAGAGAETAADPVVQGVAPSRGLQVQQVAWAVAAALVVSLSLWWWAGSEQPPQQVALPAEAPTVAAITAPVVKEPGAALVPTPTPPVPAPFPTVAAAPAPVPATAAGTVSAAEVPKPARKGPRRAPRAVNKRPASHSAATDWRKPLLPE